MDSYRSAARSQRRSVSVENEMNRVAGSSGDSVSPSVGGLDPVESQRAAPRVLFEPTPSDSLPFDMVHADAKPRRRTEGLSGPAVPPVLGRQSMFFQRQWTEEEVAAYGPVERYSHGNSIVLCSGRIVLGPNAGQLVATSVIITAPFALFMGAVGPQLPIVFTIFVGLGYLFTMWLMFQTATTDPGIVPRRVLDNCNPPIEQPVELNCGETVNLRYCSTCRVYRGPRSHHCTVCQNCVDLFDHHCAFLNCDIGAYNYHTFLHFIHAVNVTTFLVLFGCAWATWIVSERETMSPIDAMAEMWFIPLLLFIVVPLVVFPVTGLLLFHHCLVVRNKTTLEHLRRTYTTRKNPFDLGICANYYQRFFGKFDTEVLTKSHAWALLRHLLPAGP